MTSTPRARRRLVLRMHLFLTLCCAWGCVSAAPAGQERAAPARQETSTTIQAPAGQETSTTIER